MARQDFPAMVSLVWKGGGSSGGGATPPSSDGVRPFQYAPGAEVPRHMRLRMIPRSLRRADHFEVCFTGGFLPKTLSSAPPRGTGGGSSLRGPRAGGVSAATEGDWPGDVEGVVRGAGGGGGALERGSHGRGQSKEASQNTRRAPRLTESPRAFRQGPVTSSWQALGGPERRTPSEEGGVPPPTGPPAFPDQTDHRRKILSGHFWSSNFWVPDPPPTSPSHTSLLRDPPPPSPVGPRHESPPRARRRIPPKGTRTELPPPAPYRPHTRSRPRGSRSPGARCPPP